MTGLNAHPHTYYELLLSLLDHPHERLHQHKTFSGKVARKNPDQKAYPNHPDVDISDANSYYLVELEVPGVMNRDSITLS
jgi:HSP20 family molecular chaperone IbpA